jgi:hypothetical protein
MSIPDNYLFLENINTTARALLHYKWKGTMKGILERWPQRDTKEVYVDPSVNNQWSKDDKEARFDHLFVGLLALAYPEICFYIYPPSIKMNLKYALQYMINNPVDVYKALDDHDDDESGTKID